MTRTGGQVVVDGLVRLGAELAFGVPGESYLPVLDALHDAPLRLVVCRHEAAAANMAEAHGKLTGRPGICLVTRGPGATHASIGIHTARQDSTPLVLLVGQVSTRAEGREGFQELDYRQVFGGLAKWATQVDDARRLPEVLARAWRTAVSGRPGPVVVALPEDVLAQEVDVEDAGPVHAPAPGPSRADLERLGELLEGARRPLVLVGEGGWTQEAGEQVLAFAERQQVPVAASFRCQDFVDNRHPAYAGHASLGMDPALAARLRDADLLLAVGGRLGEIPTDGYTLLEPPVARQRLVHVHPDPSELGQVYQPELGLVAGLEAFARAAAALPPRGAAGREGLLAEAHAAWEAFLAGGQDSPGALRMVDVMAALRDRLGEEAILTCGAGNFTVWAHRFYAFRRFGTQLAPRSGAMGYGLPAALAAKVVHPDRDVVCIAGDGDLQMASPELATAVQERLGVVVLVVDNGMYGTIRMHQERRYPGRVVGTDLVNPDFVALARAHGANGLLVERSQDVPAALDAALASDRPTLVHLRVDPEALTPKQTLSEIRAAAAQA